MLISYNTHIISVFCELFNNIGVPGFSLPCILNKNISSFFFNIRLDEISTNTALVCVDSVPPYSVDIYIITDSIIF